MTKAELIKALRHCGKGGDIAERCLPCGYYDCEPWCEAALVNDAADALEADNEQIEDLQKQVDEFIKNETRSTVIKVMSKRIAELEAQLPKEGEWIDEQRGRWIYAKCNLCGKVQDVRSNYCPNCGARMRGEDDEQIH